MLYRLIKYTYLYIYIAALAVIIHSCSVGKHIADGEMMLDKVKVVSDSKRVSSSNLYQYCKQKPNSKWLSVFRVPLGIYSLAGVDTTKWINRTLKKFGEAPVIHDVQMTRQTQKDLTLLMYNNGYLNAKVDTLMKVNGKKLTLIYKVESGEPYVIGRVEYDIKDSVVAGKLTEKELQLHSGQIFSVNALNEERKRIVTRLQNTGYYMFNKDFIRYEVDSSWVNRTVKLRMHLDQYRRNSNSRPTSHPIYTIGNVIYDAPPEGVLKLRKNVIDNNMAIKSGDTYSAATLQQTYNNFSRLQAIKYTSIRFVEVPDTHVIDCHIQLSPQKTRSVMFQPEGTNTAGDLGAALSITYQNRNLFHGSEVFNLSGRIAYEAISGLEGYEGNDYIEYGIEAGLLFPRILFPFVKDRNIKANGATSELSVSNNFQNRPEFHRRLFNAVWRYKWQSRSKRTQYKLDLLEINYLSMPWISQTFKHDYLDNVSNRNVILRYNYEDILITKLGFGYIWSNNKKTLRMNVESSGNLLRVLSRPFNLKKGDDGVYKFLGIGYAQYVKGDVEYTNQIKVDEHNVLVLHGKVGVAYPYGNSSVLPFEKRYFAGGPNSLRGWSIRALGPGSYTGKDGRIDFINQTGDVRIDLNVELRSTLFWKLQGAVFVDAGNIWTINNYDSQPGGQFRFDTFWKQIAASYGIGFRFNFDYFVIRFDMGMKAVNPAYIGTSDQYPILHPRFSRDFAFHFAVGMPF